MNRNRGIGLVLLLGSVSCASGAHTRAGGGLGPLSVHEVVWNPSHAAVGRVRAVAEASGVTAVFSDMGATILSSGVVIAVDRSGKDWVDAAVVPGADGAAHWIVGLSREGQLYRLKDRTAFEEVSTRYGLEGERVRSVAPIRGALVAFLLTQSIAVADGATVGRYRAPQFSTLIGGGGYGAGLVGSEPYVFDPSSLSARSYGLLSVKHIALGLDGWLYAATPRAIYVGAPGGDLSLAYDAQSNTIHQIVTSRDAVWFTEGRELGVVTKDRVLETRTQPVAPDTVLLPTASSDIWALAGGSLQRFSNIVAAPDRAAAWATAIGPIFAHSCAECHVPNGVSGIDLSTVEAWESDRSAIRERVIETRTMPPQGHELSPAERAAIGAWLGPVP